MPQTPHIERHFTGSATVRDIVIGMSDGPTVPFALAAGLSGAVDNTSIIVTAGLGEIAAGSIAMGLGGYLAARSDAEHYHTERAREETEVREKATVETTQGRRGRPPSAGQRTRHSPVSVFPDPSAVVSRVLAKVLGVQDLSHLSDEIGRIVEERTARADEEDEARQVVHRSSAIWATRRALMRRCFLPGARA
jgi:hypothetical protein